jgi:hypothetical protein
MSMKRTKQRGTGASRDNQTETDFWAKPTEPEKTWEEQVDGKPEDAFTPYALSQRFSRGQLVLHPKFGKGVIVDADALRVEILFQEGKKKLGHGQA